MQKKVYIKKEIEIEGDKMNKKSIVLIGFMGVGKTTIGKELATKLQRGFIDIDEEIEKIYQMKTVDIFKKHGEKEFRRTEKELIKDACTAEGKVISVGGGAFMQTETRNICMENAIVLFLDLSWESWKDRLSILVNSRPILQGKNSNEVKELFLNRQPIYEEHHIKIKLDDLSIQEAVEEITLELKRMK